MTGARRWVVFCTVAALCGAAVPAIAQQPPPRGPILGPDGTPRGPLAGARAGNLSVQQVEQLFDRYVLGQARVALQLDTDQLLTFGPRLERLQTVRRTSERQRQRLLNELGRLAGATDEASEAASDRTLAELQALTRTSQQEIEDAYGAIDEVLRPRQRARFRVFERRMEQQKLELISRARQRAREGAR